MEITQSITVNKPIAVCWEVLGNQFTEMYQWASSINHASGDGEPGLNGASCNVRGCDVAGLGQLKERLTAFDPEKHFLAYVVIEGLPKMMKSAENNWGLTALGPNRTQLNMRAVFELNGFFAKLMTPVVKMQFGKMTKQFVEEFKYYLEEGRPHPRKVKALEKYATAKAA